jgi:hypothetical protein
MSKSCSAESDLCCSGRGVHALPLHGESSHRGRPFPVSSELLPLLRRARSMVTSYPLKVIKFIAPLKTWRVQISAHPWTLLLLTVASRKHDKSGGFEGMTALSDGTSAAFLEKTSGDTTLGDEPGALVYHVCPGDCGSGSEPVFDSLLGYYPLEHNAESIADVSAIPRSAMNSQKDRRSLLLLCLATSSALWTCR